MYQEKCRTKNEALRISSINWVFLWRLSIQNDSKLSITEKRRNKANYPTWNSTWHKFVKNSSMPNPVKSFGYIKCHSSSSPSLLKALAIRSDTTVRRYSVDQEDLKLYWKSEKRPHFYTGLKINIIYLTAKMSDAM